jgi:hypothetical protein
MERPLSQPLAATTAAERERILAAVGWQQDPRRRRVLRDLLAEEIQRIYLYGYAAGVNRGNALEGARRILMSAARTIDMVPEGCPLSLWCFFRIEEDREKPAAESDLWRILLLARGEPRSEAASPEAVASRHRLADHPQVRTLIEL